MGTVHKIRHEHKNTSKPLLTSLYQPLVGKKLICEQFSNEFHVNCIKTLYLSIMDINCTNNPL